MKAKEVHLMAGAKVVLPIHIARALNALTLLDSGTGLGTEGIGREDGSDHSQWAMAIHKTLSI